MTLDPNITKDGQGVYWLNWTADPTAEGYAFVTPNGQGRTFDPLAPRARLGKGLTEPVTASVAVIDLTKRQAETATYPPVAPPPPPPNPSGLAGGTGLDLNGSRFPGGLVGSPAFIIVSADNAKAAAAKHPHALMYVDAPSIREEFWTGVDYQWAVAHNVIRNAGASSFGAHCGDLANPVYQAEWKREVLARWQASGCWGVFIDDVCQNVNGLHSGAYSSWTVGRDAMLSFVNAVVPALRAAGAYVMLNADGFVSGVGGDDGQLQIEWWKLLKGSGAEAMMQEFWMQAPGDISHMRTSGTSDSKDNALGWRDLPIWAEKNGVQFVGQTYGAKVEYARVAALSASPVSCISSWAGGPWTRTPGRLTLDLAHATGSLG